MNHRESLILSGNPTPVKLTSQLSNDDSATSESPSPKAGCSTAPTKKTGT